MCLLIGLVCNCVGCVRLFVNVGARFSKHVEFTIDCARMSEKFQLEMEFEQAV